MLDGFATDAQRTRWLDPLLAGEIPANIATTVRREGDEHVVSGRKYFITNAPPDERCRLFLVMARLPQQPPRRTPIESAKSSNQTERRRPRRLHRVKRQAEGLELSGTVVPDERMERTPWPRRRTPTSTSTQTWPTSTRTSSTITSTSSTSLHEHAH